VRQQKLGKRLCQRLPLTRIFGTCTVKGTDGIGLLTASIRSLCGNERGKPLALLCSHFHGLWAGAVPTAGSVPHVRSPPPFFPALAIPEIVENNLLQGMPVRQQTMEIVRTPDDDIAFLYRYGTRAERQRDMAVTNDHSLRSACAHDQDQGRLLV